jgi:predicted esterase
VTSFEHDRDPTTRAAATLVLLHGRGNDPRSMHELAERLDLPDVACVAPAAAGGSWYPRRFLEPRAANEPQLSQALGRVHEILDDLEASGVPPERIVLGGFSQGASLASDALAGRPRPLGALVALCGGLIGASQDELPRPAPGALAGLPVLLTGIEGDAWVPVERVRLTAQALGDAGAAVDLRVSAPAPHEVRPEEVDALRALVLSVVDRSPAARASRRARALVSGAQSGATPETGSRPR